MGGGVLNGPQTHPNGPWIDPDAENFARFKALPRDTPLHMLNLIRFKPLADYPPGHPCHALGLTGAQAYARYREAVRGLIAGVGAAMVWEAPLECVVTGPAEEWDEAFVMGYPDAGAFFALIKDAAYVRDALPHRTAAVADSRLIRFRG
ncbi:DUF1330 domain-containing protein [Novosphingobium lubricantis]